MSDRAANAQSALPRMPVRANGRARYRHLMATLKDLLSERDTNEFSLVDLARAADVPPASVYHFLPSKDAALVALAQVYNDEMVELVRSLPDDDRATNWQDLVTRRMKIGVAYYVSNPVAMKLLLGPDHALRAGHIDLEGNRTVARGLHWLITERFVTPEFPQLEEKMTIGARIADAIWSLSYLQHGTITDAFALEAERACLAYMRLYLGEHLETRPQTAGGSPQA